MLIGTAGRSQPMGASTLQKSKIAGPNRTPAVPFLEMGILLGDYYFLNECIDRKQCNWAQN